MHSSTAFSAPCSKAGPTSSWTASSSFSPTGYVSRASPHPSPMQGPCTSFVAHSTCLPRFLVPSPPFCSEGREKLEPGFSPLEYISQLQLCSMTQLLEQDRGGSEGMQKLSGCNSQSMNFELSSGLQETLDTWCSSPSSKELNGGLIIRRDQAGDYELEPIVNPLSDIDQALMFGGPWSDVSGGSSPRQERTLDMKQEERLADAEVWLDGTILGGPSPQDTSPFDLAEKQGMELDNDVVWNRSLSPWIKQEHQYSDKENHCDEAVFRDSSPQDNSPSSFSEEHSKDFHDSMVWNRELSPWIKKGHTASAIAAYFDGAAFEDAHPLDNHSSYHEEWTMNGNDKIVVRQRGNESIRQRQQSSDTDIAFHETALNVYSSSPVQFTTKAYNAALSHMLQSSPEDSSLHIPVEQGMEIWKDVAWNHRTSPWIKEDLRSSVMEIYFDEAVPEAYSLSPLRSSPRSNKSSLSYILQSPPIDEMNDRSPPSSPTKPRYQSPNKTTNDSCQPVYLNEDVTNTYTPSPLVPVVETHLASLPKPSPAEVANDRPPKLRLRDLKEGSPDGNKHSGFGPVHFRFRQGHNYAKSLLKSKILSRKPFGNTSHTLQTTKHKPGRPSETCNKKKTLSPGQSKKIAATALKRFETLRRRPKAQEELQMAAASQEGNASKNRKKRGGELNSGHENSSQLRRESVEFERRINVMARMAGDGQPKGSQYGAEEGENRENWERVAYSPNL